MVTGKKILASCILVFSLLNIAGISQTFAATNKETLLTDISSLETKITNLKTTATKTLEDKVFDLSEKYNGVFTKLGYDEKAVAYLVSLGKLTTNFKEDLALDFNNLTKEISDSTATELNNLTSIKNNIKLNYSTVSDNEKTTLSASIKNIENNYTNLSQTFTSKTTTLANKYSSSLSDYENQLKNAYSSNTSTITSLNNFSSKYEALYSLYSQFEKNYTEFKNTYLTFAGDLTIFSENRQKNYVSVLRGELEKIRDGNIEANKSLETYRGDIDRLIAILLQNFENSLTLKINESYGVIYSDEDVNSLISRYNTVKNKYYSLDGKIKASEVLSNTGALEEINFIHQKISDVNTKITTLLGTGSTSNTYDNVKIRLENEMIKYYNDNYKTYREDLLARLKEKLDLSALETKNILLAADTIDLRYSILNDRISKSNDFAYINAQITSFKKDIEKYTLLNNSTLNTKISNLQNNLELFYITKELSQFKYTKMSQTGYTTQLEKIIAQLKDKSPNTYKDKLKVVVSRIDVLLGEQKLSDKTRFMLLVVKLNLLNAIK
ncbi:MAG: hypothetical protein AB7E37_00745 [Candidatus Altimarinota bacterium]